MASFTAEFRVAGYILPIRHCHYDAEQFSEERGRVVVKVRKGPVEFVFDVPDHSFLEDWALDLFKRLPAEAVFFDATGHLLETLSFAGAYCVGYQEFFASGDAEGGAYQCRVTLSDPDGWNWQLGEPTAYMHPILLAPALTSAPVLPKLVEVVVEESVWTRLGLGILRVLEAGASFPALLAGFLLLPQTAHAPGIPQHPRILDKDALRLAELEHLNQHGQLTKDEQAEYLALLAKVRGIHLDSIDEHLLDAHLRTVVSDYEEVHLAGMRREAVGEFDGINMKEKIFIEDKNAEGLRRLNPKTGLPAQSPADWAEKHIYNKTNTRIEGLKIAKYTYPQPAPDIEHIRDFRRLHFRLDADAPDLRAATEDAMRRLRAKNPGWEFTAQYGKN
ncbi:type VI secretion system tube protein TssD [Hymenobacter negativus]|uniref:Uncharacterized protein n=1 Tax=Hymenobacter negativus TaxID=2795026 RepID=A0ABS3QII7_9BACT|nr:type VI secretion system tube protein TssD [Hymenobacter negativus]MBO2011054.1 hypothetical protein [Hymenobacter negativus]